MVASLASSDGWTEPLKNERCALNVVEPKTSTPARANSQAAISRSEHRQRFHQR